VANSDGLISVPGVGSCPTPRSTWPTSRSPRRISASGNGFRICRGSSRLPRSTSPFKPHCFLPPRWSRLRWYSGMRAAVQACASALALAPSAGDHLKSGRPHQRSTRQRLARRGRRPADKSRRRNGKADESRPNQRASASRTNAGVFDRIHQILLAGMNAANRVDWSRSAMGGSATLAWSLNQFPAAQPSKSTPWIYQQQEHSTCSSVLVASTVPSIDLIVT
jgi:hypothetical protein